MDDLRERQMNADLSSEKCKENIHGESDGMPSEEALSKHPDKVMPLTKPVMVDAAGLQNALLGLTNMALAHEIALNKDFKLTKPDKSHSAIRPEVQFEMDAKEQYWSKVAQIILEKDVKECKSLVLQLFNTLKSMLLSTLLPHNVTVRDKIEQELDETTMSKQIDGDAFDFEFILDTLANLCCPIRDQEIVDIRKITNPSEQVKKTMELMENMNLDMANFIISQSRNTIVKHCVTYERNKFASYIDIQYRLGNDPINVTRDWILKHTISSRSFPETIAFAFAEIFDWGDKELPETLALDWTRFPPIREEVTRVTVIGAMIACVYDYSQTLLLAKQEDAKDFEKAQLNLRRNQRLVSSLREELHALITYEEIVNPEKFKEALERCCIQVIMAVDKFKVEGTGSGLTEPQKEKLSDIIRPLVDLNHPVRMLLYRRAKEWFMELVKNGGAPPTSPAPNLSIVAHLIHPPITEMLRLVAYNRGVFDVVYKQIFDGDCPPPKFMVDSDKDLADENIISLITKLDSGYAARTAVHQPMHQEKIASETQRGKDEEQHKNEPSLSENRPTTQTNHFGSPNLKITHEDLLKLLNRENILNENNVRNRIQSKGPTQPPTGARDQHPYVKDFPPGCRKRPDTPEDETVLYNEKGERILSSRNRGNHFGDDGPKRTSSTFNFGEERMNKIHTESSESEIRDLETPPPQTK